MPSQPITPISPITNVRVCRNVPFDSTYTDVITFGSATTQAAFFAGKAKFSWSNATPVKNQASTLRLPVDADKVYDCNYICWQNANFGTKWFYGFITDITYVNPNSCFVQVELDVFQTWAFDYTVHECYVVREHPNSDNYGEHILLEPLEVGEYVDELAYRSGHMDNYRAVIMYAKEDGVGDGMVGGTFTGLTYMSTPLSASGSGAMLDLLQQFYNTGKADAIVASYIMPADFYTTDSDCVSFTIFAPKATTTLGSYTPRNKKLLCYPYNMLAIDNTMGTTKTFRYEYFTNLPTSDAPFTMACGMGTSPEVVLYPRSYNGQERAVQEQLTISGFPQFGYIIDTFRAWMAQNANSFAVSGLGSVVSAASSLASLSNPATAGIGVISSMMGIAGNVATLVDRSNRSNTGSPGQGTSTMLAMGQKDFYFFQRHIREDYAAALDDYFDMYGYQTDAVKVPNITGRPSWNYVKTDGAKITGSIPFDDITKIKAAFDRGITFWHGDYIGQYNRNNRPA